VLEQGLRLFSLCLELSLSLSRSSYGRLKLKARVWMSRNLPFSAVQVFKAVQATREEEMKRSEGQCCRMRKLEESRGERQGKT
jgi:hypothetical protein